MTRDPNIQLHGKRRVFDGFLKVDEAVYSFDSLSGAGRHERQKRQILERGDSAAALVHEVESDCVLLTKQVRASTIEKGPGVLREIVAGVIEAGESAEACIRREIEEEIGYRIAKAALKRIGTFYVSPGGTSERIVLFYAQVRERNRVNPDASGVAAEGEDIALVRLRRAAFVKQALAGRLDDAKTLVAGLWLAARAATTER